MKDKNNNNKDKIYYTIFTIITILAVLIITFGMLNKNNNSSEKEISYTELITKIEENAVEEIEMTVGSTSIKVKLKNVEEKKNAVIPNTQAFIEFVQEKKQAGNGLNLVQKPTSILVKISTMFINLLPTLMIVALFVVILKMQGLGDKGKV